MNRKILLDEKDIPRQWYNIAADLPTPMLPPLGPDGQPVSPDMLAPVFPMNLIEQEVSTERWIDIPEEILDILYRWRPAPLRCTLKDIWIRPRKSITKTKVPVLPAVTSPIRPFRRRGIISNSESNG